MVTHRALDNMIEEVKAHAQRIARVDHEAGRHVARMIPELERLKAIVQRSPHTPVFFGHAHEFDHQFFTADSIYSLPIYGPRREIFGAMFPSQPLDPLGPPRWSRTGLDRLKSRYTVSSRLDPISGMKRRFGWSQSLSALWADEAKTKGIILTDVHSDGDGYFIKVDSGRTMQEVQVNGANFARVQAANDHFRQAIRNEPNNLNINLGCRSASGTAARENAEELHKLGINSNVYAARENVTLVGGSPPLETPFVDVGVHVPPGTSDTAEDHWAVYKRGQPADRPEQ
ncbi:hypothetical protein [Nocardia sp. SC052]|uniref:hypothetical protein n=1 Tax=Nocardia sichangensis TaxID=3385975 RepID=UPI0039A16004